MIYFQLFLSFLKIGALSFGGGYAAMPLIQNFIVAQNGWLNMSEFTDLVTISQMTPGPIAINAATFVGVRMAGIPGAIAATAGCIFPSCVIVSFIAMLYIKYQDLTVLKRIFHTLRPAVAAMIASSLVSILVSTFWTASVIRLSATNWTLVFIFAVSLVLLQKFKKNPIGVMLFAGFLNILISCLT